MIQAVTRIVGNRELILGMDHLYRDAMKSYEVAHLLPAARTVAEQLNVTPANAPVEGYYAEGPELLQYFQWMRALQQVPLGERARVEATPEFQALWKATQSPVFGLPGEAEVLLPACRDALYFALRALPPEDWNIPALTVTAAREAVLRDDFSLVGLACRAQDAVCIAALRESVVLYAEIPAAMAARTVCYKYEWRVDPEIAATAGRFIEAFGRLVPGALPPATKASTEHYFHAAQNNRILGRCARIGWDDRGRPAVHYHWAIHWKDDAYAAEDFWSEALWTTERYRRKNRLG